MPYFESFDGLKIFYKSHNLDSSKTPMVFVHGILNNYTSFSKEMTYFRKKGYPVIALDLRGHGKSSVPNDYESFSFDCIADDINCLLKHLSIRKRIVLVGHSFGGMAAVWFTKRYDKKVSKLVVIDSSDHYPDKMKIYSLFEKNHMFKKLGDRFLKGHLKRKEKKDINLPIDYLSSGKGKFFVDVLMKVDITTLFYACDILFDVKLKHLSGIDTESLIIASHDDEIFTIDGSKKLAKKIKNSVLKILPGNHALIFTDSNLVSQEIEQFMFTKKSFFS